LLDITTKRCVPIVAWCLTIAEASPSAAHARCPDERHAELLRDFHDRRQGRRTDGAEQGEHVVFLHKSPRLQAGTGAVVVVVAVPEDYAPAGDAAQRVDAGDADFRATRVLRGHRPEDGRARGHDAADGQRCRRDARVTRHGLE
jgi:hypothetical protein